jgi:hypothetical protein
MTTLVTTDAVTLTVIASALFNNNFAAVEACVNGNIDNGNISPTAAIAASKLTGVAVVRGPYSFAFNTASINSGVTVYTPTAQDILIDAWIEITTAFDGTTPKADIGSFSGTTSGLWDIGGNAIPLGTADSTSVGGAGISVSNTAGVLALSAQDGGSTKRLSHSRFTAATPIKLVVSQTGLSGGTAIGGTAGAAKLYLITATPVALP